MILMIHGLATADYVAGRPATTGRHQGARRSFFLGGQGAPGWSRPGGFSRWLQLGPGLVAGKDMRVSYLPDVKWGVTKSFNFQGDFQGAGVWRYAGCIVLI